MGKADVVVGTSSWADPGFVEEWYPPGLPARDRLPYYAGRFDGVEVNSTFYAVPSQATVRRWTQITPEDFTFDVKLHRLLSRHAASTDSLPPELRAGADTTASGRVRLDDRLESALARATIDALQPLADARRLACLLLQLTPGFSPRRHHLDELAGLVELFKPWPVAIELRHRGWVEAARADETLAWFEDHGVVWVGVDAPRGSHFTIMPPVDAATHPDFAYIRAHGRNLEGYVKGRTVAERFAHRYSDAELEEIAGRAGDLSEQVGRQVRLQFNNNRGSDAPVAAQRTRELLGQTADRPAGADGRRRGAAPQSLRRGGA